MKKILLTVFAATLLLMFNSCQHDQKKDLLVTPNLTDTIVIKYLSYDSLFKVLPPASAEKLRLLKPQIESDFKFVAGAPLESYIRYIDRLDSIYKAGGLGEAEFIPNCDTLPKK